MFCKNCGSENKYNILNCVGCGKNLSMTSSPLDGGDRIKIVSYFVLWSASFIFGIVPILVSLGSIYIMKKDKSYNPITTSKIIINTYVILLAIGCFMVGVNLFANKSDQAASILLMVGAIAGIFFIPTLINYLYFSTFEKHQAWIVLHGIFSDKPNEESIINTVKNKIQSLQNSEAFSAADELLKWKTLLDQGAITEEEFKTKKEKLL